jgi:HPr kinase/phosphorylase
MKTFTVLELLNLDLQEQDSLQLRCIAGRQGLTREIKIPDLNRPGLALSGFFDNFAFERIQIFGRGEHAYLEKIHNSEDSAPLVGNIRFLFESDIPCAIFTHDLDPSPELSMIAKDTGTPVLQTDLPTSEFSARLMRALSNIFARTITTHGVLVEVFGIGIFITGDSGVGKSETALELIHRGHRIVADDSVEIKNVAGNILIGSGANRALGHHMEIRGLGIINISHLFGVGAIRETKQIQLVVELEPWDSEKEYDRIGAEEKKREILGINVPYHIIPVKPGRNIPIIIETAAMNERLKKMGYYSAKEFNQSVMKWLESENARKLYMHKKELLEKLSEPNLDVDDRR